MRRIIVVALVTLLVPIAATSVAVAQCAGPGRMVHGNTAVEAIKRIETERNKALVAGDIAAIDRLYSDDYTSAVANTYGTGDTGGLKCVLKLEASSNDETNVRVYGNTAVVTGKSTVKRHDRGVEINGQVYFTRVWVKQMGRWRLVANHASSVTR